MSKKTSEKSPEAQPTQSKAETLKDAELDKAQGGAVALPLLQSQMQKARRSSS